MDRVGQSRGNAGELLEFILGRSFLIACVVSIAAFGCDYGGFVIYWMIWSAFFVCGVSGLGGAWSDGGWCKCFVPYLYGLVHAFWDFRGISKGRRCVKAED